MREVLRAGVLRPAPEPGVLHAIFELCKTSLTTPDATRCFAAELRVRPAQVEYAGLKDKHASTSQHVSVKVDRADAALSLARMVRGHGWSATLVGWAREALRADVIDRNGFRVVVRGQTPESCRRMQTHAARLSSPDGQSLHLINYFGDQRFASARHGQGFAATHLVKGEFEAALRLLIATPTRGSSTASFARACAQGWGDWARLAASLPRSPWRRAIEALASNGDFKEAFASLPHLDQVMAVEAFQSHVWNRAAHRWVIGLSRGDDLGIIAHDPQGELAFPTPEHIPEAWYASTFETIGPDLDYESPWSRTQRDVLASEGLADVELTIPGLRRPRFGSAPRALAVCATAWRLGHPEPDEYSPRSLKRVVEFELPRGAYATVVLRALGH